PLFLSSSYSVPRALHSFPTRRSSDLSHLIWLRVHLRQDAAHLFPLNEQVVRPLQVHVQPCQRLHRGVRGQSRHHGQQRSLYRRQDRKSTRLNSSHVAISYAVFCLKKK